MIKTGRKFEPEALILCVLLVLMTIICSMQVIWRYVLQSSLSWSGELARYLFVWLVWLGAVFAAQRSRHIRIEFLKTSFPEKYQKIFDTIAAVVTIAFAVIMTIFATQLTKTIAFRQQVTPAMQIPMWVPCAAVPFGSALMAIRILQNLLHLYRGRS